MISIRNLSKNYGAKPILQAINLELERGKVYGIVGQNGAGKTTLFKCIAGLEDYDGDIQAAQEPIKDYLGFLPTNPVFMSHITAWEYLKLLCLARGIEQDDFESQNIFELPLDEYAENYSTGMKKKLALWGTILQQNDLFILDEPYNGVDIHSNMMITEIIKRLKASGKTILIASHIFSTLSDTCDLIYLLKDGQIAKRVEAADFDTLDEEMKTMVIGNSLEGLRI